MKIKGGFVVKMFILGIGFIGIQSGYSREWSSIKAYQKATQLDTLTTKDWLTSDRKQNTFVWRQANLYNLKHLHPEEYQTVTERFYFYRWLQNELQAKQYEVTWIKMARFISDKLRQVSTFPYKYFVSKSTIKYTNLGSEVTFNNAFFYLNELYFSSEPLKNEVAKTWDLHMLKLEQREWVTAVYKKMDAKSLHQISRIAKGKGLYRLFIPESLQFTGDLKDPEDRLHYAVYTLLPYCKSIR